MPIDARTDEWDARRLSLAADAATLAGRCEPDRPVGVRTLVCRITVGLIVVTGSLLAIREFFLQTDDRILCENALHAHDWNRLEQSARKWLERSPRNGDAWMYLAQAAEHQGDLAWAATALARVPDAHPQVVPALHRHLALTAGRLNRPLEAAETLERLLAADSRNPDVHRQAITFYAQTFQHARLVEQVRSSIALQCDPPEAYIYLAAADEIRVSAPASLHQRWTTTYPDCPLFAAAKTLSQMCESHPKQRSEAPGGPRPEIAPGTEARLDAALARFPDNVELLALRLERSIDRGDQTEVGRLLDRAPVRTREDDRFWRYAGWRYAMLGEPGEAEAACRRAQELNPLSWKTKRMLAMLLHESGREEEAGFLERLAHEGEAIHTLVAGMDDPTAAPAALLRRIADFAVACDDDVVARGIERHFE